MAIIRGVVVEKIQATAAYTSKYISLATQAVTILYNRQTDSVVFQGQDTHGDDIPESMLCSRAPAQVVDRHKKRAWVVWGALWSLIMGYTVWLIVDVFDRRQHPSVSLKLVVSALFPFLIFSLVLWNIL